jgi:phytoene dehydrogenase-like protein
MPNFKRQVNNIKYRGSTARIHFALNDLPEIPHVKTSEMEAILSINPSINYLEKAHDDIKYGNYSQNPHLTLAFPSITNPSLAPKGKHVLSATVQHIPYKLKNENWNDHSKNELSKIIIKIIEKYVPNFSQYIEHQTLMTPQDFENSIGIKEGSFHHGELSLDQFYFMRPTMKTAQYSTPFKNLFLCGSGTHPGEGPYGANAYNAVKKILNS